MFKRFFSVFVFSSLLFQMVFAQPIPCEDPPTMTSFCADACIICDIDGFTGRHESSTMGEAPSDFCTFVVHNAQWIAFIAGSEDLEVQMSVSNCQLGIGLEFALYESSDCQNFNLISNCFGGMTTAVGPGSSAVIANNVPLEIGQYYYIVMDGAFADNCDWTFTVLNGSTAVDPLTTSGIIQGDNSVCPDLPQQYFIDPPIGATEFEWTVNGVEQNAENPNLDYTFPTDGVYNICVTASNACDEAPPSCYEVVVASIPTTEIIDFLCEGEVYEIADTILAAGGFYEFDLQTMDGCDSLVTLELTEVVTPLLDLTISICEGDTLFVGTTPYTQTGIYQETLISALGCDSIVSLNLSTIVCNITSTDTEIAVVCNGEASGGIEFFIDSGTPPFSYSWEELNGTFSGAGNINALGEIINIDNIPTGTYVITIDDGFGNFNVIVSTITEPPVLSLDFAPSDYNGVNVSCADGSDGELSALASGGVSPYAYSWDSGQQSEMIDELSPGMYTVTVTDEVGCTLADSFELLAPEPLLLIAEFQDSDCSGLASGNITAVQTLGGAGGYTFSLNGSDFTDNQVFDELPAGDYLLEVMDGNACTDEAIGTLTAPQIPEISLGENYEISLGDFIEINPVINPIDIQSVLWQSTELLTCPDCLEQEVQPLNAAFYTLSVTSADGCTDTDSVFVEVNKFRKIYIPNVFTPNFDGLNDYFTIYGGPEVARIQTLRIFNRWGAVVFDGRNLDSGMESQGWDGTFRGKDLGSDVYAWMAEVAFIDGEVLTYSGDILIIK